MKGYVKLNLFEVFETPSGKILHYIRNIIVSKYRSFKMKLLQHLQGWIIFKMYFS